MAWSGVFVDNADPLVFDPTLDTAVYESNNNSIKPVPALEQLLATVIDRIQQEGQKINPAYTVTLQAAKQAIAANWSSLTYDNKFRALVDYGRQQLTSQRDQSVQSGDYQNFYKLYFFRDLKDSDVQNLKQQFKNQDYGFGMQTIANLKQSALNTAVDSGLVPEDTNLDQYEQFIAPSNQQAFTERLLQINGGNADAIIDPEKITADPYKAAAVFQELKQKGALALKPKGGYEWTTGHNWRDLKSIQDGSLLNTYQKLLVEYEDSPAYQEGKTLSQYIALKNRTQFEQIASEVTNKKQNLDTSKENLDQAKKIVTNLIQQELGEELGKISVNDLAKAKKIEALKADVFQVASQEFDRQKQLEEAGKFNLFNTNNSLFQEMAADLGVKPEFFNLGRLQSNVNYNWQNWFENELRERYNPNNPKNQIKRVLGETPEDLELAGAFVQDYLQRRFDGSKSLSEFMGYLNPTEINPVLETDNQTAWRKFTRDGITKLAGSFDDPTSVLGNFWTNLQSAWAKGRDFNGELYSKQALSGDTTDPFTVSDLHSNLQKINQVAMQKESTNLSAGDIKDLDLKNVDTKDSTALDQQVQLYQQWFQIMYNNGVDIQDPDQFARLHYSTYLKSPDNPVLRLDPGRTLQSNSTNLIDTDEVKLVLQQVQQLALQADEYADQIQFSTFKTPEEYVMEMVKGSGITDPTKDGDIDLTDTLSQFVDEFSGVISSYAGEVIRQRIREAINQSKQPSQQELGVEFIQRTRDQALSTIKNLIAKDLYSDAIVIDNAPGIGVSQSLKDWFGRLGLELIPGKTWEDYKRSKGLAADLTLEDWEKEQGKQIDPDTNKLNSQIFWEQWTKDNNIQVVTEGTADNPRMSLVVQNPSTSWLSWAKRISADSKKNSAVQEKLEGAGVQIRSDDFNKNWYSRTNPFTQVRDDWNRVVGSPNREIISLGGKSLGEWAKESGLNPEEAWNDYRERRQKERSTFGVGPTGNDMSFVTWSQEADPYELERFWKESSQFWFRYIKDLGLVKNDDEKKPIFKTWNEWAIENNIPLNRVTSTSKEKPPSEFMQLHYAALGGKKRVDEEYLQLYFPEFGQLNDALSGSSSALNKSMFDMSQFGFSTDDFSSPTETIKPFTATGRTSVSPIDFAMSKIFGDNQDFDLSSGFADDEMGSDGFDDLDVGLDMSYNINTQSKKKSLASMGSDFGFGDFGGSSFGF